MSIDECNERVARHGREYFRALTDLLEALHALSIVPPPDDTRRAAMNAAEACGQISRQLIVAKAAIHSREMMFQRMADGRSVN